MICTKDIDAKLPALFEESAILAREKLPDFHLGMCESPIEKLFLLAAWSRGCWTDNLYLEFTTSMERLIECSRAEAPRAICAPQVQIGPYRVDFLFAIDLMGDEPPCLVAVECDGHEYHEKTKAQAARDKARDRDIIGRGIKLLRFTGSEIWRDAGGCAAEVLAFLNSEFSESHWRSHRRIEREHGSVSNYLQFLQSKEIGA